MNPLGILQSIGKVIEIAAFAGFMICAVLFINLNRQAFDKIFGSHAKQYWWLMLAFLLIPILLVISIFSFLFMPH